MEYSVEEHKDALRRCFNGQPRTAYARMDGWIARDNPFIREGWNYAIEQGWLRVEDVELEQETFMKGFLTDNGYEDLGIEIPVSLESQVVLVTSEEKVNFKEEGF